MLSIKDFHKEEIATGGHYLAKSFGPFEICLEPCLSGYCVAIYGNGYDGIAEGLLEEKKCTAFKFKSREKNLTFGVDGLKNGEANMVLLRAMKFANEFYKKYNN